MRLEFLFCGVVQAAVLCQYAGSCEQHTEFWHTNPNTLFLHDSYLPLHGYDPCASFLGRAWYLQQLETLGISCNQTWCTEDWQCFGKARECPEVEHIIDLRNSWSGEKQILGNIVLARGSWNAALGRKSWPINVAEKSRVYGEIFRNATVAVQQCSASNAPTRSAEASVAWFLIVLSIPVLLLYFCL